MAFASWLLERLGRQLGVLLRVLRHAAHRQQRQRQQRQRRNRESRHVGYSVERTVSPGGLDSPQAENETASGSGRWLIGQIQRDSDVDKNTI